MPVVKVKPKYGITPPHAFEVVLAESYLNWGQEQLLLALVAEHERRGDVVMTETWDQRKTTRSIRIYVETEILGGYIEFMLKQLHANQNKTKATFQLSDEEALELMPARPWLERRGHQSWLKRIRSFWSKHQDR